jgi:hypothetical protein
MKFDPIAPGSSDVGVLVTAPSALPAKPTSFLHQQPSYLQSPDLSPMKSNSAPGVDSPLATVVSTDHSVAMNNQQTMRPLQLAPAVVTSTPTTTITETCILEFDDAKQKGEFLLIVGKLLASFKSHTNISNAS